MRFARNQYRQFPVASGLMSDGPKLEDNYYQAGMYAVRIIKGDRPADLPAIRPSKCNLVIDVTTAKSLGLDIPQALLARADEVIE